MIWWHTLFTKLSTWIHFLPYFKLGVPTKCVDIVIAYCMAGVISYTVLQCGWCDCTLRFMWLQTNLFFACFRFANNLSLTVQDLKIGPLNVQVYLQITETVQHFMELILHDSCGVQPHHCLWVWSLSRPRLARNNVVGNGLFYYCLVSSLVRLENQMLLLL